MWCVQAQVLRGQGACKQSGRKTGNNSLPEVPTNQGRKSPNSYLVHLSPRQEARKMENPSYLYFSLMIYLVWLNISEAKVYHCKAGETWLS